MFFENVVGIVIHHRKGFVPRQASSVAEHVPQDHSDTQ